MIYEGRHSRMWTIVYPRNLCLVHENATGGELWQEDLTQLKVYVLTSVWRLRNESVDHRRLVKRGIA